MRYRPQRTTICVPGATIVAWSGSLFAHCTASGDMHFQSRSGGLLNDLAHRQPDERWNLKAFSVDDHHRRCQLLPCPVWLAEDRI